MKGYKILSIFSFFVFFIFIFQSISFSVGVYELNGEFIYYTSNPMPTINLNISSPSEDIRIVNASFSISDILLSQKVDYNTDLLAGENKIFTFTSTNNISKNSLNIFKLFAYGLNDGKKIIPSGDPTDFIVKLDTIRPELRTQILNNYKIINVGSEFINLNFDEEILSYKIFIDGKTISNYFNPSKFKKDFKKDFRINFSSEQLVEGNNKIQIEFTDLAENKNLVEFNIFFRGPPIQVTLKTNKDDSNLKYFYDPKYSDFFEKTIYSSTNNYDLVINTSKVSNCYISSSLTGFNQIKNVLLESRQKFSSIDGRTHTIQVSSGLDIWVACQNPKFSDDVVYLNNALKISNDLIKLRLDGGVPLKLDRTFPDRELTSNIFDVSINTNKRAICFYKLDNQEEINILSIDNLNHNQRNININNGQHNIIFNCFDVIGNKVTKQQPFNVDSTIGVRISGNFPIYTLNQIEPVNFSVSEDVLCKYTTNPNFSPVNFNNLSTNISGNDFSRNFRTNTLNKGKNIYYILCDKNKNIIKNQIEIVYDPNGPTLSNLSFINNGVSSNYIGSLSSVHFKFDTISLTPIDNYYIEFVRNNDSIFYESKSNEVSLNFNLSNTQNLKIIAQNLIGMNSSVLEKNLLFDLNKPQIGLLMEGNSFKITCFDAETSCYKINYGLSKTNIDCVINSEYLENSSVEIKGNKYLCVKAYDQAQNFDEILKPLVPAFDQLNIPLVSDPTLTNDSQINTSQNQNNLTTDEFFTQTNFPTNTTTTGNNLIVVAAIFLLIAGVSGGGYYAYNRGYLNDQLKKLGIKNLPNNQDIGNENKTKQFFTSNKNKKVISGNKKVKKSSYDDHLNKLNKFIDDKINNGKNVFDKFNDDKHKGQVKGYDDTLIRKNSRNSQISKEEFDEFYSSSKKLLNKGSNINLEKDSEAFEKYYKEKKSKTSKVKKK